MQTDLRERLQRLDAEFMETDPRGYREALRTQMLEHALRRIDELQARLNQTTDLLADIRDDALHPGSLWIDDINAVLAKARGEEVQP